MPATGEEALTVYSAFNFAGGVRQVTLPDATQYKEFFATTGWQKGLITKTETWASGVKKKETTTQWTQDNITLNYQMNPRVTESAVKDFDGQGNVVNQRLTTVDYNHLNYADYGLPYKVTESAVKNGTTTVLRETYTDYNLSTDYLNHRIIGLVSARHVTDGAGNYLSKTVYEYDAGGEYLMATAATPTQHDTSYNTSPRPRGNLTSVARYNVEGSNISNANLALTTRIGYDTDGSVLFNRDPAGHQTSISYADSFSDDVNRNTFAYPTLITDADNKSSSFKYSYDLGTVTRKQDPKGAVQTMEYDAAGRIQWRRTPFNGAWQFFAYPVRGDAVQNQSTIQDGAPAYYSVTVFDGANRVMGVAGDMPNSTGLFSGKFTQYDVMGRVWKQSNPTEITNGWVPAGDDAIDGWQWTIQSYDWKGRPRVRTNTDGTTTEATYDGCGCAGGETVTLRDEVGRTRKSYTDALGRVVKLEEFNRDQNQNLYLYRTATTRYNALDQVSRIRLYAGEAPVPEPEVEAGTYQTTTFDYDGYGRLWKKKLPQQDNPTIYGYYADGLLHTSTDARGVTATYSYNGRHLLTGITYPPSNQLPAGVAPTSNVTYSYDEAGNRTLMTDGQGSTTYHYDQLSRMDWEERYFSGISGTVNTFRLSYAYNLAGQVTGVTDNHFGSSFGYNYDSTGRLSTLTGSGTGISTFITDIKYRAWGAPKQVTYGNGLSINATYNRRLQVKRFETPGLFGNDYQYYDDGRLKYSQDLYNSQPGNFDRSFTYDPLGRITEARSGAEARGESPQDGPYHQTYGYDQWNNLTSRSSRHWSRSDSFSTTYDNKNRQPAWSYDADGRVKGYNEDQNNSRAYEYDAAGRSVGMKDTYKVGAAVLRETVMTRGFDGDGNLLRDATSYSCHECTAPSNILNYYVRSSVLGKLVMTVGGQGQRLNTYVYSGDQLVATQSTSYVNSTPTTTWQWKQASPSGTTDWNTQQNFGATPLVFRTEMDAVGADTKTSDPYPPGGGEAPSSSMVNEDVMSRYSDSSDLIGGCYINYSEAPCDVMLKLLNFGRGGRVNGFEAWSSLWMAVGGGKELKDVVRMVDVGRWTWVSIGSRRVRTSHAAQDNTSDCGKFVEGLLERRKLPRSMGAWADGELKYQARAEKGHEGFKEKYISAKQLGWGPVHIAATAAGTLLGHERINPFSSNSPTGYQLAQGQFDEDTRQLEEALGWRAQGRTTVPFPYYGRSDYPLDKFIDEKHAEREGDGAGTIVGHILEQVNNGDKTDDKAKEEIFNLLCDR